MVDSAVPESPRIAALSAEISLGNTAALDAFWMEVADKGAPLIEPIADDRSRRWSRLCGGERAKPIRSPL